jgi:hypothetical protein
MPTDQNRRTYIGVDLGQRRDFSAIAAVERALETPTSNEHVRTGANGHYWFTVRLMDRLRLQTPYTDVAQRVHEIANMPLIREARTVVVDGTGVGPPVIEMIRGTGIGCSIMPIIITGGTNPSRDLTGQYESVPRSVLLTNMQVLIQQGHFRVAAGCKHADTLRRELLGLKLVGPGTEEHDDLAFAVALALWEARKSVWLPTKRR